MISSVVTLLAIGIITIISYLFFVFRRQNIVSFWAIILHGLLKLAAFRCQDDHENNNDIREEKDYADGEELPKGLRRELMPRQVAVIMDGNRRWAKKGGLMIAQGHKAGAKQLLKSAQRCFDLGIHTFSAFTFSTENWARDKLEVDCLMALIEHLIASNIPIFKREEIRVSVIGSLAKVPESLLSTIKKVDEATKSYKSKHLIMAVDYSGRFDIVNACKNIVKKTEQGLIHEEDVDEKLIESELLTNCTEFPNPDLLIRTSGEQRISNFFLWQCAYSELFFSQVEWPAFDKDKLLEALVSYQQRERRFGANA